VTIRVVLADDNVLVREGVRALLDASDGIEVVGVAEDAPSLLAAASEHEPDVVVTDIKMPPLFQLEGINCAHEIRQDHPETGVVVLSAHDDEAYALALLGKGHSGLAYLLKDRIAQGEELVLAISEVASGGSRIDPTIAARLSDRDDTAEEDTRVLDMMASGLTYAQMAAQLDTTEEAVDRLVTELFGRLATDAGRGASHAVDQIKQLHSAVVERHAQAETLRSFVPTGVADRLSGEQGMELQEECEATILFSDIRGFSTLAERLPPRELAVVLAKHLAAMAEVVLAHGGTIDKFAGDAVMAVFGVPDEKPDHAELALRCALAMQQRQSEMNWEAWAGRAESLGMGIGVNTGTVIAGTLGGAGRLEYTVVGDAVNIAQRLQSEAAAGEVLAAAATIEAAPSIPAVSVGPKLVKGRKESVEVYRVVEFLPETDPEPNAEAAT
jgi:class 3 adenylate cyclase/DNA-binding NarL/FixJ family response regulator